MNFTDLKTSEELPAIQQKYPDLLDVSLLSHLISEPGAEFELPAPIALQFAP